MTPRLFAQLTAVVIAMTAVNALCDYGLNRLDIITTDLVIAIVSVTIGFFIGRPRP